MSMISEQMKLLANIAERLETDPELDMDIRHIQDFWAKDIRDAINTIETLSAKVRANDLHHGWIKCEDRLPAITVRDRYSDDVITVLKWDDGDIAYSVGWYNKSGSWNEDCKNCKVIAWHPLPEPFKEDD